MNNKKKGDKMNEDQIILNEMEQYFDAIEKVRKEYLDKRNGKDNITYTFTELIESGVKS